MVMRLRGVIVFGSLLVLLSGCAVPTTYMKNDATGQMIKCQFVGIGVIGVIGSVAGDAMCVNQKKKEGFHIVDPPSSQPGTGGAVTAVPGSQSQSEPSKGGQ